MSWEDWDTSRVILDMHWASVRKKRLLDWSLEEDFQPWFHDSAVLILHTHTHTRYLSFVIIFSIKEAEGSIREH